ncbi:MAG: DMT family transporter [Candidatus Pacebacteria bacterium]|jgi:drug/metabolite transporter (DMT)-like permease|nr:DMT family transporter [Candidatus Paceibacterota bacterium]MBT4652302.1 DMT family transporter [Candidatus Paceibacterota bacterium]MBT6756495.1 DMT family transporter [Candidatus Paceibacterota bacterium]MBT6921468.1 DMT family transporter [Candidatus Paceibacterota bacterium]
MINRYIKKYLAYLLLLTSVFAHGLYTGIQKQGLQEVSTPIGFAFYSMVYCSVFLLPFAVSDFRKTKDKKDIFNKKTLISLFSISILSQFIALSLKLYALKLTTATNVGFIASFSAVTLVLYSVVLLKEKLPKRFFLVLTTMFLGFLLFRYEGNGLNMSFGLGETLVLIFIFVTSFSNSLAKITMNNKTSPFITSFARPFFATFFLGLTTYLMGDFSVNNLFSFWPILAGFMFAARIVTLYSGLNLTRLSNVAIFNTLAPLITFSYSFIFLKETLNPIQMMGAFIMLSGAYGMAWIKKNKKANLVIN